jgi:hypothetical protein
MLRIGSPLGIEEIAGEPSTGDGALYDPFLGDVPKIMGDAAGTVRAADTLQFGTRNALCVILYLDLHRLTDTRPARRTAPA